jgi:maleate isomerase
MAPDGVSIHAGRVFFGAMGAGTVLDEDIALEPVRAFSQPPHIDEAVDLLSAAPVSVIVYAFTSSSYANGAADDPALAERLSERAQGIPVVVTCQAAVLGLRAVEASKIAMVNPPWFSDELTKLGAEYFTDQGFNVVHASSADLPGGQMEVHAGELYGWCRANVPSDAEAVFVGGNGFRAIGVIAALEEDLQRPVLTANQVAFWNALHIAGTRAAVNGYGTLFDRKLPVGREMSR